MAVITDLADAIVAELNAATFSQPITAERHYLPQFDLPEMKTLHVTVVPRGIVSGLSDRSRGQGDYSVDVAIQKRLTSDDNADIDPLLALVEEIADHFHARRLASYPNAVWLKTEQAVLYAPEHIADLRQFTSVLTLTYRVVR